MVFLFSVYLNFASSAYELHISSTVTVRPTPCILPEFEELLQAKAH